jgi:hypothetical protein
MISTRTKYRIRVMEAVVSWLTPERLKLYPPHIPIITILFWAISQLLGPGLFDLAGQIIGTDFLGFYTAGNIYLAGEMDRLYDFHAQYIFQKKIVGLSDFSAPCLFVNPPFTAPFFSLFSRSSYLSGLLLWWLAGLIALFFSVYLLRSELKSLEHHSSSKLFRMCFLFFPSLCWFMYGQNTAFSLFLYTLFFVTLRKNRDYLAGFVLGLLLYKPQLLIGPIVAVIAGRRWFALFGSMTSGLILLTAGYLLSPAAVFEYVNMSTQFFTILRPNPDIDVLISLKLGESTYYPFVWGNQGFWGFSVLLLDNIWKNGSNILSSVLITGGVGFLISMWLRLPCTPGTRSWDFAMAVTFVLGLLLSPHLFIYDMMLLLLPLAIIWGHYPTGHAGRPLDGGRLLFWTFLLYLFSFIGPFISLELMKVLPLLGFPPFSVQVSTIIMVGWLCQVWGKREIE